MSNKLAPHPGDTLRAYLIGRGWSQVEFAWILGRPVQHVNKIINGKKGITANTAHELAAALGTEARFWMKLDSAHKLYLSHKNNPDLTAAIAQRMKCNLLTDNARWGCCCTCINRKENGNEWLCSIPEYDHEEPTGEHGVCELQVQRLDSEESE